MQMNVLAASCILVYVTGALSHIMIQKGKSEPAVRKAETVIEGLVYQ